MLGVPYGRVVNDPAQLAREQAQSIAKEIRDQGGPRGLGSKQIVALMAYLQRLGTDLTAQPSSGAAVVPTARQGGS